MCEYHIWAKSADSPELLPVDRSSRFTQTQRGRCSPEEDAPAPHPHCTAAPWAPAPAPAHKKSKKADTESPEQTQPNHNDQVFIPMYLVCVVHKKAVKNKSFK